MIFTDLEITMSPESHYSSYGYRILEIRSILSNDYIRIVIGPDGKMDVASRAEMNQK